MGTSTLSELDAVLVRIEQDWTAHMDRVRLDKQTRSSKPTISSSTTIADAVTHLNQEVQSLNSRVEPLAKMRTLPDTTVLNTRESIALFLAPTLSTETMHWRLKTAIACAQHFYIALENSITLEEENVCRTLLSVRRMLDTLNAEDVEPSICVFDDVDTGRQLLESIIEEHEGSSVLEPNELMRLKESLRDEESFVDYERQRIAIYKRGILLIRRNMSRLGVRTARQRMITEFFSVA